MNILAAACLLLSAGAAAYYLLSLWSALAFFRRAPPDPAGFTPPVTLLKPVRGADRDALENFLSFCRQDYPRFQVLFGALDADDPAVELVRELKARCPESDVGLVTDSERCGANLKVCNLAHLAAAARYRILVMADADMRVPPDYLRRVVAPLADPQVGLVTCLYRCAGARSLPGLMEALGVSAGFLPGVLLTLRFSQPDFALGSTIAVRAETLQAIGGFEAIADYLADDYQLGHRVWRLGLRVHVCSLVLDSVLPDQRFGEMLARRLRWARTVRACRPAGYAGTFFTQGVALAFLGVLLSWGASAAWMTLAGVTALRLLTAGVLAGRLLKDRSTARWLPLLPLADLFDFGIWIASWLDGRVSWRGARYRIVKEGRIERLL